MAQANVVTDDDFELLLELEKGKDEADGWELKKKAKDIEIWIKKTKSTPVHLVKSITEFAGINKDVMAKLFMEKQRIRWDAAVKRMEELENCTVYRFMHLELNMPIMGISNRDFILCQMARETETEKIVVNKHSTHPSKPDVSGVVRGKTIVAGYIVREKEGDPETSILTNILQVDFKGYIPTSALNSKMVASPENVSKLLRQFYTKTYKAELEASSE